MLDFGYMSELTTRYAMVASTELAPFFEDEYELINESILNWYLMGFRFGMLWKIVFDIRINGV